MRIRLVLLMSLLVAVPGSTSTDPVADPLLDALAGTPREIVARTGERTVQGGTARIVMEANATAPLESGTTGTTSNGEGVIDLREKAGQMKVSAGWTSAVPPNETTSVVIFTNRDVYTGMQDVRGRLGAVPGMKPWLRMTGAGPFALGRYIGLDLHQPYLGLEQLGEAVSVTEVARDRVRGVAVRHFHVEISLGTPDRRDVCGTRHRVHLSSGVSNVPQGSGGQPQGHARRLPPGRDQQPAG